MESVVVESIDAEPIDEPLNDHQPIKNVSYNKITKIASQPITGDNCNSFIWLTLIILSGMILVILVKKDAERNE